MPISMQLAHMREMDITDLDRASLTRIDEVAIDTSLPIVERMERFISQVKNPYCFLCGDTPVRVRFISPEKTLAESLSDYFISLK